MVRQHDGYAACVRLAHRHYENFPVASWLLPPAARAHVAAVYAFARGADNLADEGVESAEARLAALHLWRSWLHRAAAGDLVADAGQHARLFAALAATIRDRSLPLRLFDDLVDAFAQDVTVKRYRTWEELLDYCRRSANPVGRLVLRICGYDDDRLDRQSDCVCTALQLTNFWQDLRRDWAIGRLYVPEEIWTAAGARSEDFNPRSLTPAWRHALVHAADRTRALFSEGRGVCDGVSGRLRYELRLTWLGGMRILERVDAASGGRPTLGVADVPSLAWRFLRWSSR